ncbi:polyketide biosynthesis enoyl-CoA hydratase [Candidatus Magnetomorum sp. HK-1]|nr:polyketide biosynthesis enoyl-CoA hydratase [Candidatus Magnetomorum sp. HK-1]
MPYEHINVRFDQQICFLQFDRPDADNTMNQRMIDECIQVLALCEESATVIVFEGLAKIFCMGGDFSEVHQKLESKEKIEPNPEPLYNLWLQLTTGPFITISHVRGKANAGGIGFVAASDIALANESAVFSLSELLFGLFPACVIPFLIRRMGFQKANYLTLTTSPVSVQQAYDWGLIDAYDRNSELLLRKHLLRLRRFSKTAISRYKKYMSSIYDLPHKLKLEAIKANKEIFSDMRNLEGILRYVEEGKFPWEK